MKTYEEYKMEYYRLGKIAFISQNSPQLIELIINEDYRLYINEELQKERDKKLTDLLGPEPIKVPSNYDQAMEHMRWLKSIYKDESN